MNQAHIVVRNLSKTYRVPERKAGLAAALKSMMRRTCRDVEAVREISFDIQAGEMVGFIGPNGAGKTTTLKMLAGLLAPSGGEARVLGFVPWERKADYLRRISMVLGNKSQMMWDIPALDTFRVLGEIYHVPPADLARTLDELVELLELGDLLARPVRNLSLGERMKCELVAGLLYRPAVLFLDEPTLGLDVSMQGRLRRFLLDYMADVVALCPRVILIHHGRLLYDGELNGLARQLAPFKLIQLALGNGQGQDNELSLPDGAEIIERENGRLTLRVSRQAAPAIAAQLLNTLSVADLSIQDPPIAAVIDQIYQGETHL
jgi:ABC-2 type transport system ATP-binding protein